jgi:hypothetical protein
MPGFGGWKIRFEARAPHPGLALLLGGDVKASGDKLCKTGRRRAVVASAPRIASYPHLRVQALG